MRYCKRKLEPYPRTFFAEYDRRAPLYALNSDFSAEVKRFQLTIFVSLTGKITILFIKAIKCNLTIIDNHTMQD